MTLPVFSDRHRRSLGDFRMWPHHETAIGWVAIVILAMALDDDPSNGLA